MSERPGQPKNADEERPRGLDHSFSSFATWVAKWTGSQWAFIVAAFLVLVGLLTTDMATTNLVISIVTLLMVLVLQNTENRHSAALHVKLDEVVRAAPEARDDLRGVESRPEREIRELTRDDEDALFEGAGELDARHARVDRLIEEDPMSERETQRGDPEVGVCHVCGETFPTQEELSKHLIEAHEGVPSNGSPGRDPAATAPTADD